MPTITIDGQKIETKPGQTVIQAAYDNGMKIPHFCWHPELTVAGNCRMCLVEAGTPKRDREGNAELDESGNPIIQFIPKLQIACATQVSDGMVIRTNSDKAIEAQEAVMEFLLINHPLDCPICDEAGECKLQEYGFKHSTGQSRFDEQKNHKPKRQVWGPNVVFDAERCISCSRCIRYAEEVAEQPVLSFVQRGDHVSIELFEDTVFDSPFSMNVIELCPVGALTSDDFRFKSRVWEMSFSDSVTDADASGANIRLGVRNNEVLRVQPRTNMYVNQYWLTDDQRLNHIDRINDNRLTEPQITIDGVKREVGWDEAYGAALNKLMDSKGKVAVVASARSSNEDLYALKKFSNEVLGTDEIVFLNHFDETQDDKLFPGVKERRPNARGARALGMKEGEEALVDAVMKVDTVFIVEEDFADHKHLLTHLENKKVISLSRNEDSVEAFSEIALPTSTFAEIEGTFTNVNDRVQHFGPALTTKENFRFMGMKMSRWDKFGAPNDRWTQHEQRNSRQVWRSLQKMAALNGNEWGWTNSSQVFAELAESVNQFSGMEYKTIKHYQGLVMGQSEPDPKVLNYISHSMKPY
ncbi:MAG: 2Fe-2S iron-sulfur cluster-binding protein [Candidatus Kapaibacteriales bacterium]